MNELKNSLEFIMYKHKINKRELSDIMDFSYPTTLSRLENPDTFKVKELRKLCSMLEHELVITIKNKENE